MRICHHRVRWSKRLGCIWSGAEPMLQQHHLVEVFWGNAAGRWGGPCGATVQVGHRVRVGAPRFAHHAAMLDEVGPIIAIATGDLIHPVMAVERLPHAGQLFLEQL